MYRSELSSAIESGIEREVVIYRYSTSEKQATESDQPDLDGGVELTAVSDMPMPKNR